MPAAEGISWENTCPACWGPQSLWPDADHTRKHLKPRPSAAIIQQKSSSSAADCGPQMLRRLPELLIANLIYGWLSVCLYRYEPNVKQLLKCKCSHPFSPCPEDGNAILVLVQFLGFAHISLLLPIPTQAAYAGNPNAQCDGISGVMGVSKRWLGQPLPLWMSLMPSKEPWEKYLAPFSSCEEPSQQSSTQKRVFIRPLIILAVWSWLLDSRTRKINVCGW